MTTHPALTLAFIVVSLWALWFTYYAIVLREHRQESRVSHAEYIRIAQDEAKRHAAAARELEEFRHAGAVMAVALGELVADMETPKVVNRLPIRFLTIRFLTLRNNARKAIATHEHFVAKWKRMAPTKEPS